MADQFAGITKTSSVVKISSCLEDLYNKICESREKNLSEHKIHEIEHIKAGCKSDIVQLAVMSCQTFVRLAEIGTLEQKSVLSTMISMLPNSSPIQQTAITEAIVSLLLLGLKQKVQTLPKNEKFQCQYGLRTSQHPLITLIQNNGINMIDIANKINTICNHHDSQIKKYSIEYLRPVFLYILCNPQILNNSKTTWTCLLNATKKDSMAKELIKEVISWSKISTSHSCLFTSILLIEAIDYYLSHNDLQPSIDLILFQAVIVNNLIQFGYDPRPSLHCILRVLNSAREFNRNYYNVLLILLAESIHCLSPAYLPDLFRILAFIIVQENCGNQYILNMCLDGCIQWMSQTAFIPTDGVALAQQIIDKILLINKNKNVTADDGTSSAQSLLISTKDFQSSAEIRNLHPDIALAFNLAKLAEGFGQTDFKDVFAFIDTLSARTELHICLRINLFLRSLFLSREPSADCWFKIYQIIMGIVKSNENIAYDFMMTYIMKLAHELNPEMQLELLRGLPNFAVSKDNMPMILSTLRSLIEGNAPLCMDLYLRLWRVEGRTYPFLVKLLSQPHQGKEERWEYEIARAHTIREICFEKPTQYGPDFVAHLSDILNTCTDDDGDLATSWALDAIVMLCDSGTVDITSTWRVLSGKFRHEKRPVVLKSLINFFAHVPLLQSSKVEYQQLLDEAIDHLWSTICHSDDPELIREALKAMKNFEVGAMMTLRHIPPQFTQNLHGLVEYSSRGREVLSLQEENIPGECWVQLLQKIRPECGAAVADLMAHYIYLEIDAFRSGVYYLPEGKPEPTKLKGLFQKSTLRAVVSYLVSQSRFGDHISEAHVVTNALRAISKKFPKPIPPLDWCFLHSFFHLSFEVRKYCILIAKNQVLHSGTALRLLENFLVEFEPNCFEEDLLLLFNLLPEIANGVSLQILKAFAEKIAVYCFKESQLSGFVEGCLFESFLDSVKSIFTGKCDIPEVLDIFTLIVERYIDSMDLDSRLFERYTEVVATLDPNSIDGLTLPSNWWETPVNKLKKATIIRCYLVLYNTKLPNPLKWLSPIIEAYAEKHEEQDFFFRHLATTLYAFKNDEHACAWTMEFFFQIHALLAESSKKEKLEKVFYLLDVFILVVDVLSGCAVLLGNLDVVATSRKDRIEIFPESMHFLCDHAFWKDQEAKIYEFLASLYRNTLIPEEYSTAFRNFLICSRNKPYFESKNVWTKYVGMRK